MASKLLHKLTHKKKDKDEDVGSGSGSAPGSPATARRPITPSAPAASAEDSQGVDNQRLDIKISDVVLNHLFLLYHSDFCLTIIPSGVLIITIVQGRNLNNGEENVKPLCVVEFDQHQINTKNGQGCNPVWNEELKFDVTNQVEATVWVYNGIGKVCHRYICFQ